MKSKNILLFLILLILVLVIQAQGEINGYLSFEFIKGQSQSLSSVGTFQNALLGLIFSGEMTLKLDYVAEARFRDESKIEMEQAYLRATPSPSFSLKLGLYLVPFGKYNSSNRPHQTVLVKAPLPVEALYPLSWRDIGILVEGRMSGFFYSAYLGNGLAESKDLSTGQQFQDNNKNKSTGLRGGLSLGQGLEAGFSYYRGKYNVENDRNLILKGVDVSWISEGFTILSEYTWAEMENPFDIAEGEAEGYFIQVAFDMGNIRPVGSYQKLRYEDVFHGEGFHGDFPGEGIDEERSRWTAGIVYLASPNVFFKVEYEFNREEGAKIKDNLFLFQLALSF